MQTLENGKGYRRYRWHSEACKWWKPTNDPRFIAQNPAWMGTGLKLMVDAEKSGKVIPLDKDRTELSIHHQTE